jgi:protein SCO1/2
LILLFISCIRRHHSDEDLPYYNEPTLQASWIDQNVGHKKEIHTIHSFSFKDQTGTYFSNDSLKGKVYVVNFFFTTCPSICPKMTVNLKRLQDSIYGIKDVKILSFSVMPWVDSVARLSTYAKENGIDATYWHLLTGNQKDINFLARNSFFAEKQVGFSKKDDEFIHTELMFLVDRKGSIRGVYNATQMSDIEKIIQDIHVL